MKASLNYLADLRERPAVYLYTPPEGTPRQTTQVVRREVPIRDGRLEPEKLDLDEQGVTLLRHETGVADLYDPPAVREAYYPEMERLVAEATGAERVLAFDHNVRCAPLAERGEKGAQRPVRFVHNDYTERSGPQRVRDLVEPDEAEARLARRFAVINVWRPIEGPVEESPLGVCDARSIEPADLVPTDLVYRDRKGEVYSVAFNPAHRWIYFPRMEHEEAMLLKCYDSAQDGRARYTAHSAFVDPSSPPDAAPRQSIEVRTLAFF